MLERFRRGPCARTFASVARDMPPVHLYRRSLSSGYDTDSVAVDALTLSFLRLISEKIRKILACGHPFRFESRHQSRPSRRKTGPECEGLSALIHSDAATFPSIPVHHRE